jgi:hypothetical protein
MPGTISLVSNPASRRQVILRLQPGERKKLRDGLEDQEVALLSHTVNIEEQNLFVN